MTLMEERQAALEKCKQIARRIDPRLYESTLSQAGKLFDASPFFVRDGLDEEVRPAFPVFIRILAEMYERADRGEIQESAVRELHGAVMELEAAFAAEIGNEIQQEGITCRG